MVTTDSWSLIKKKLLEILSRYNTKAGSNKYEQEITLSCYTMLTSLQCNFSSGHFLFYILFYCLLF